MVVEEERQVGMMVVALLEMMLGGQAMVGVVRDMMVPAVQGELLLV